LHNAVTTRAHDRGDFGGQVGDLARGTTDLARQVSELGRRISTLEGKTQAALAATHPINAEIGEVGGIIQQMAETVAAHDSQLKELTPAQNAAPTSAVVESVTPVVSTASATPMTSATPMASATPALPLVSPLAAPSPPPPVVKAPE